MEICVQSKHDALDKQRKELLGEKQKLDVERMRHVREVKLQWDYNMSSYNIQCHQGILCNRYVLLNLFGKGGFAEVCSLCSHEECRKKKRVS
jgi:hypothetical protein